MTLTHVDLFSGIGGFALAARWAGLTTVQFVELDPFCQRVLQKNFPGVKIHGDIKTFANADGDRLQVTGAKQQASWNRQFLQSPFLLTGGQIPQGSNSIRHGVVDSGLGRPLSDNSSGDVDDSETQGMPIQGESTVRGGESLPQGDESVRQGTEPLGASNRGREDNQTNGMRGLRGIGNIQGRKDSDTGTSPRLRKTIGGDVAMPEMSSSDTQNHEGGGDANGFRSYERPFLLTGGFP